MKYKIGEIVKIVPPKEATPSTKDYLTIGLLGTVTDYNNYTNCYEVEFQDKFKDWYFETWLEKVEEGTNIPQQPTVPPMPKKKMNWSKIKELTAMALAHNKDIVITINADGSKEIEITTPTTSIVETQMRTRYVPEGTGFDKQPKGFSLIQWFPRENRIGCAVYVICDEIESDEKLHKFYEHVNASDEERRSCVIRLPNIDWRNSEDLSGKKIEDFILEYIIRTVRGVG